MSPPPYLSTFLPINLTRARCVLYSGKFCIVQNFTFFTDRSGVAKIRNANFWIREQMIAFPVLLIYWSIAYPVQLIDWSTLTQWLFTTICEYRWALFPIPEGYCQKNWPPLPYVMKMKPPWSLHWRSLRREKGVQSYTWTPAQSIISWRSWTLN